MSLESTLPTAPIQKFVRNPSTKRSLKQLDNVDNSDQPLNKKRRLDEELNQTTQSPVQTAIMDLPPLLLTPSPKTYAVHSIEPIQQAATTNPTVPSFWFGSFHRKTPHYTTITQRKIEAWDKVKTDQKKIVKKYKEDDRYVALSTYSIKFRQCLAVVVLLHYHFRHFLINCLESPEQLVKPDYKMIEASGETLMIRPWMHQQEITRVERETLLKKLENVRDDSKAQDESDEEIKSSSKKSKSKSVSKTRKKKKKKQQIQDPNHSSMYCNMYGDELPDIKKWWKNGEPVDHEDIPLWCKGGSEYSDLQVRKPTGLYYIYIKYACKYI